MPSSASEASAPAAFPIAGAARLTTAWERVREVTQLCWPHLAVAALILAYAIRFSMLSVSVYNGYGAPGFDMSIPDQGIWLLSRFHAPFVTVMGRDLFADHTSFIFLLVVPLFWVYPHAQALLVLQSCILAAAAIPIYLLALRRLENAAMATILAAAYLLNPALQNGNMEQVHVEFFTVLFVSLAIYAAVEGKGRLLAVATVGLLLCKEDAALLVIPLAVWVLLRRNRRWGLWMLGGAGVGAVAASAFIYMDLGQLSAHGGRVPFGGVHGLVHTAIYQPGQLWDYLTSDQRPFYVWQMLGAFGLIFLRAPEIAATAILVLGANVLSAFGYEHEIQFHYSLPLVPILALGTVFAVSAVRTEKRRYMACAVVGVAALWSCLLWGLSPISRHTYPHLSPSSPQAQVINATLRSVPPNAAISAYYPYIAHLDHRVQAYQWPTPWSAQYWGTFQQEGQRLPFANQVQYVIIPTTLTGNDAQVWASIRSQFALVDQGGGVAVYKRVGT